MAEVFLAHQRGPEGFNRRVAVKRVLPHLVESDEFVRMFHDEARLAARLTHPNIAHIYEFGRVDEHYFIAMEYLEGVHAGMLIKRGKVERLPPTLVARIGADACAGLRYAHDLRDDIDRPLRIVHRDVSPPNLMITFDGVVKLVDFGIAKAVSQVEQTRPGVVKGKYAYMSPEQTTNKPLDGKSDVFSLGLVLWELLAGRVAFDRADPLEVMRAIRDGKVPDLGGHVPPGLAAAVMCALERDHGHRPTAAELGLMLEGYIKAQPDLATSMQLAQWVQERFPRPKSAGQAPAVSATAMVTVETEHTAVDTAPTPRQEAPEGTTLHAQLAADDDTTTEVELDDSELTELVAPTIPEAPPAFGPPPRRARGRGRRIALAAAVTAVVGGAALAVLTNHGSDEPPAVPAAAPAPAIAAAADAVPVAIAPVDAPPVADAGPALAVLEVLTDPAGAVVSAGDGRPTQTSPAVFADLPPGPVALRIELDGYDVIERVVDLAPGQERTLDYTLSLAPPPAPPRAARKKPRTKPSTRGSQEPGRLTVRTQPYSVVYLGARKLGVTPFADLALPPGRYTLRFKNPDRGTHQRRVIIRPGARTKLDFELP